MTRRQLATLIIGVVLAGSAVASHGAVAVERGRHVRSFQTTYQGNPRHDGRVSDPSLAVPLKRKWSIDTQGPVSYPIVAGGRVFVTVGSTHSDGSEVLALSPRTGRRLWRLPVASSFPWSALAYGGGRLFVVNFDGLLLSVVPKNGRIVWARRLPGQYSFSGPPVVAGGTVYAGGAGGGGTVYAVAASTGKLLWKTDVGSGDDSSPAVSADRIFVVYGCPDILGIDRAGGAVRWEHSEGCSGGGGLTASYHDGRVYVPVWGYVMDPADGSILDHFTSDTTPAFGDGVRIYTSDGNVEGVSTDGGQPLWTFDAEEDLITAPLVVNSTVYVGSANGTVYGVDEATGAPTWSGITGHTMRPAYDGRPYPTPGLGAGSGVLLVPGEDGLTAFGPGA